MLKTFNAVLAISRLQAAGAPDQVVFNPAELAADVADLYGPFCEDKNIDFKAEFARGLSLRGNREFLAQALSNLLDNAIKYTPEGGAVTLRVRPRSSGEIEFSVTDTGPGVAEADRARVVQRFVRLDNSRKQPGVGLKARAASRAPGPDSEQPWGFRPPVDLSTACALTVGCEPAY